MRVTHLAAGAPPISVYANDDRVPLVASLASRESTDYVEVSEETSTLRITAAGASPDAALLTLDDLSLFEDEEYTVVAFGTADEGDEFPLEVEVLVDDVPDVAFGTVAVRPVHVAPGVGDVDVYAMDGVTPLLIADDLPSGAAADYAVVPTTYDEIGIDLDDDGALEVRFPLDVAAPGVFWTAFVAMNDAGDPILLAQARDSTTFVQPAPQ